MPTTQRVVALTFDCGANADGVPSILATLAAKDADATFFLTGQCAERFPGLVHEIAARFPVANHSYSHPHFTALDDAAIRAELARADGAIERVSGRAPERLFRFPYGDRDARTLRIVTDLGYLSIRWSVDTLGWQGTAAGRTTQTVIDRVLGALEPGSIVLMHVGSAPDGTTLDAAALPTLIDSIRARGYRLVTIPAGFGS